jgi:predicted Zn-dependent protease
MKRTVLLLACLAGACARNPVTHKLELSTVSEAQEVQMGQEATKEIEQQMGFYKDPKLETYLDQLGKELASKTERPHLPWQFHVVDDASVNAFALPGGSIFITRGILATLNDEAELAAVLGHEIGHVTAKHSVHMISRQQMAQLGLGLGMILSPTLRNFGQAAGAGMQLLFLKFSRDAEGQADSLGFKYMIADGYDPREMVPLFDALSMVGKLAGGGKLPEYLQTHPYPEQRKKDTEARLQQVKLDFGQLKRDEQDYLQHVDGIVYGEDPRNGFFQANTFLHPAMRFQVQFPPGWKTQNLPQAVVALSPNQDAVVQLAGAGNTPVDQAAKAFLSQQGIQPGQVAQANINGQPAVVAAFAAQTDQAQIAGIVTFLRHGEQTFGVLGYSTPDKVRQYEAAFKGVPASFGPLTDPNVLSVQPARVQLVRLDRDMTIEEFLRAYPSNASPGEIALINGLVKEQKLRAGQMAKRVVGGPPRPATPQQQAKR